MPWGHTLSVTVLICPATRFMMATSACTSLTSSLHTSLALLMDLTATASPVAFCRPSRTTPKAPLPICLSRVYISSSFGSVANFPNTLETENVDGGMVRQPLQRQSAVDLCRLRDPGPACCCCQNSCCLLYSGCACWFVCVDRAARRTSRRVCFWWDRRCSAYPHLR